MATTRLSNPLALAVLTMLYERPMHPYEMSTTLRERNKEDSIKLNYGSLYSVVAALEKQGFVEVQETVREGKRPERTIYAITEAGKAKMIDWLSELLSVPRKEFTDFEAALSLIGALPPDDVLRLLQMRLQSLEMRRRSMDAVAAGLPATFPRIFLIESEFQSALLDAEIEFVRSLIRDMRTGELSGLAPWRRLHELRATDLPQEKIDAMLRAEFPDEMSWQEEMPIGR